MVQKLLVSLGLYFSFLSFNEFILSSSFLERLMFITFSSPKFTTFRPLHLWITVGWVVLVCSKFFDGFIFFLIILCFEVNVDIVFLRDNISETTEPIRLKSKNFRDCSWSLQEGL